MPRYELSDGSSNKFWQIEVDGAEYRVSFGKIGSTGQTQIKSFDSAAKAIAERDKLIVEKTKKGYQRVGAAPIEPEPEPVRSAAAAKPAPKPTPEPTTPSPKPRVAMTAAAQRLAETSLAALAIKPATADNPIGEWLVNLHRPFVRQFKTSIQHGATRGNPDSQRLSRAVLRDYASIEKMPATLDLETAAAALQLATYHVHPTAASERETSSAFITFWAAHSGLGFALEAFVTSLWGWSVTAASTSGQPRWLVDSATRRLHDLFAQRCDLAFQTVWRGATDEQRAAGRARAETLRAGGDLLRRSAIASCVLEPAWIDADLREHATTGARAMLSPEALLVATVPADIAAFRRHLSDEDRAFHDVGPLWPRGSRLTVPGYAHVARFGLGGIDIVCAQIAQLLATFDPTSYVVRMHGLALREQLEVLRLAHDYPPAAAVAIAVMERIDDSKFGKDDDPRPLVYDCLRGSPVVALPLVRAIRRRWAKELLPQLERLASGGAKVAAGPAAGPAGDDADVDDLPEALRAASRFKAPELWQPLALPRIALRDGTLFPVASLSAIAAALKAGDAHAIDELVRIAEPASLATFAWDLFQAWLTGGAPSKDKWAFTALGRLGNDETARRLTPLIRVWPGEAQHARAVTGLDVLGNIGSDVALMMLDGIAQKLKFKGLQERARDKMGDIAATRGMTAEQLADRLVPDLDLEDDGSKTLDFGPRSFRVGFDETLSPFVVDATGARLRDLPKPNSKDDAALGAEATEIWKAMKKDARALASIQLLRLELAMGNARRWSGDELKSFLVDHPLLTHLVKRLVWGVYAPDDTSAVQRTFRVAEDRSYADDRDETCSVAAGDVVGIVHRLHLTDAHAATWGKLFGDYELAQPFEQLSRATYRLDGNTSRTEVTRFEGREVESKKLLGLLSRGWRKGSAQDNGSIFVFYKPIRPGLIAGLPFQDGLNAGGMDYVAPTQTLGGIDFSPTEPDWGSRKDAVALADIDEVVISEVIRDVESIGVRPSEPE